MSDNINKNENLILNKKEEELLLDHSYDGIEEFDYPLPSWWLATFIGGVVAAIIYIGVYNFSDVPSVREKYQSNLAQLQKKQEEQRILLSKFNKKEYLQWTQKQDSQAQALLVYEENCLSCHEENGKGDIGPNLTDSHWLNLKKVTPESIYDFIRVGNEDNGMPAWEDMLSKDELYAAVAYVMSVKDKNIAGKEPQGETLKE